MNRRTSTLVFLVVAAVLLGVVALAGWLVQEPAMASDFSQKNLAPSFSHLFGTDWMGRDMLCRTLAGLSLSIRIGLLTALVSACIALTLGVLSAMFGGWVDAVVSWWI